MPRRAIPVIYRRSVPGIWSYGPLLLYMAGKLCITMAFGTVYIYTAELFPTTLRHSLLGICSMTGRIGSILSPQTPLLVSQQTRVTINRRSLDAHFPNCASITLRIFQIYEAIDIFLYNFRSNISGNFYSYR